MPQFKTYRFQLRIELAGASPLVWRELSVPSSIALESLHEVIQCLFGWDGSYLHEFQIGQRSYGIDYPGAIDLMPGHERQISLQNALGRRKSFVYRYRLGGGWDHRVSVRPCLRANELKKVVCIAGQEGFDVADANRLLSALEIGLI